MESVWKDPYTVERPVFGVRWKVYRVFTSIQERHIDTACVSGSHRWRNKWEYHGLTQSWTCAHDRRLLAALLCHGYGKWAQIAGDETFGLGAAISRELDAKKERRDKDSKNAERARLDAHKPEKSHARHEDEDKHDAEERDDDEDKPPAPPKSAKREASDVIPGPLRTGEAGEEWVRERRKREISNFARHTASSLFCESRDLKKGTLFLLENSDARSGFTTRGGLRERRWTISSELFFFFKTEYLRAKVSLGGFFQKHCSIARDQTEHLRYTSLEEPSVFTYSGPLRVR